MSSILDALTPAAVRLALQTSSFEEVTGSQQAGLSRQQEPWFSFPYTQQPVSSDLLQAWGAPHRQQDALFSLPVRNPYIPSDFQLVACSPSSSQAAGQNGHAAASNGKAAAAQNGQAVVGLKRQREQGSVPEAAHSDGLQHDDAAEVGPAPPCIHTAAVRVQCLLPESCLSKRT